MCPRRYGPGQRNHLADRTGRRPVRVHTLFTCFSEVPARPADMDVARYSRVIWKFRHIVATGIALAAFLAFLSFFKIGLAGGVPHLTYRTSQTFQNVATLFVTQPGFPWGRAQIPMKEIGDNGTAVPQYADTPRFNTLAILYSHLGNGDEVGKLITRTGPLPGTFQAAAVPSDDG